MPTHSRPDLSSPSQNFENLTTPLAPRGSCSAVQTDLTPVGFAPPLLSSSLERSPSTCSANGRRHCCDWRSRCAQVVVPSMLALAMYRLKLAMGRTSTLVEAALQCQRKDRAQGRDPACLVAGPWLAAFQICALLYAAAASVLDGDWVSSIASLALERCQHF